MPIISKETWDNLIPAHEKDKVIRDYQIAVETGNGKVVYELENIFGKANLQPKPLTYEEVARELFGTGINDKSHCAAVPFMGMRWSNKIQAIGRLLVVARFLNKDWKPDWENGEEDKFYIGIDNSENKKLIIKKAWYGQYEIVYFRTVELAEQAIQILEEDIIRLALTTDF